KRVIVYAFDVDETLEISNGPVKLDSMRELRSQGHIIGICGNYHCFCNRVSDWPSFCNFLGQGYLPKEHFLHMLKNNRSVPADDYVMVGNVFGRKNSLGFVCGSHCSEAAAAAGWRFIVEGDFAA